MSGGSHDYLYRWRPEGHPYLHTMAADLERSGAKDVADRLRKVHKHLKRAQNIMRKIEEPLHAMEWLRSGDYAPETFDKVLTEWRNEQSS